MTDQRYRAVLEVMAGVPVMVVMVATQRIQVGMIHARKTVTVTGRG